uniref:ATP synthase subunit a n=1 Tax=Imerinia grandidieri TaxID=3244470 RepID=G8HQX9_9EUPU|nr:ATP synthase subunit 6 [Rhopalocaulis grandidieri]
MMADLFSSLDGAYSWWSWGIPLLGLSLLVSSSFTISLKGLLPSFSPMSGVKLLLMSGVLPGLFTALIFLNFQGLVPLVYSITSGLWCPALLGLTLWLSLLTSGFCFNPKEALAHLAPSGAPTLMIPLLVLIESISILIRPLTLTVRLVANISAGHIVLSLVASSAHAQGGLLFVSIFYSLFEFFVCFIQAYIFTLLISLYAQEHP